jgi:hypothetical protein
MLMLPRTIRLDPSDAFVFAHAAEPGEWAVTGSFLFVDADVAALAGKARAAFRAGFVGVDSLGVTAATASERESAVEALAGHIHATLGAPSREAARAAAAEEVDFAASLCQDEPGTILAMHRTFEGGKIREQFRSLRRRDPAPGADRLHAHDRAFEFVEVEEEPGDAVDLVGLAEAKR